MSIDIKTLKVEPRRHTFGHIARRFGVDKPASRYEEATLDVQATDNFHYKPLWDADRWIYDERRSAVKMADWYALRDPRQYYYATYNIARANQYQATDRNFDFVEKKNMLALMSPDWRGAVQQYLIPLRHAAWGANMNASNMCALGYGTAVTAPCIFSAGDQLAIAQIISRIGLLFDGGSGVSLDKGKALWMTAGEWQGLRRLVEDTLVIEDWFELFLAQNLVLDGVQYPLVYGAFDAAGTQHGGAALSMLTEFMSDWFAEHSRWVDAVIKGAAAESDANRTLMSGWYAGWRDRALAAWAPLAEMVLGAGAREALDNAAATLNGRAAGLGLNV